MCHATRRVVDAQSLEEHCAECGLVFTGAELVAPGPLPSESGRPGGSGRGIGPFVAPGTGRRVLGSTLSVRRDGQGKPLAWHRRYEFEHLRRVMLRQTSRAADGPFDRSMARPAVAQCAERLSLPPVVVAESERIFRDAKVAGAFRGRNLPSCVGATVYAACRRFMIPRTLGEVAKASAARRAEVGRAFKVVQKTVRTPIPSMGTKAFLHRYAEELALSGTVRSSVEQMLDAAYQNPELSGLSPHGLVAALIYLASERHGERRSRAQVARVSAVTEVTLRSTSRLVERLMGRASRADGASTS
jgi:transcription initiation factor TFIIB